MFRRPEVTRDRHYYFTGRGKWARMWGTKAWNKPSRRGQDSFKYTSKAITINKKKKKRTRGKNYIKLQEELRSWIFYTDTALFPRLPRSLRMTWCSSLFSKMLGQALPEGGECLGLASSTPVTVLPSVLFLGSSMETSFEGSQAGRSKHVEN